MFLEEFLKLLFPERCINCDRPGTALCAICERTITTRPQALSRTTAVLFDYQHPLIKKAIWSLKYHRKRSLGRYFGTALYREFFKHLGGRRTKEEIILLPVPASKKAIAMRGYNHAAIIADAIALCAKADGLELTVEKDTLYKKKENAQQVRARERKKREANVANIFGIREGEHLEGKTVILIDDVITTGATINEAKKVVRAFHPKRILAIAVAH